MSAELTGEQHSAHKHQGATFSVGLRRGDVPNKFMLMLTKKFVVDVCQRKRKCLRAARSMMLLQQQ